MIKEVIKRDGRLERFYEEKLLASLLCCLSYSEAEEIAKSVESELGERATTEELFSKVRQELWVRKPEAAVKFGLREDMMKLGPAGYNFEDFYSEILKALGMKNVVVRQIYKGRCAVHELDVVYNSEKGLEFAEMKYHNQFGIYTGLKEAMYTFMRLVDLNEGGNGFAGATLVTNTKVSDEAIEFSECRGLSVVAWKYPRDRGLEKLIETTKTYPVTSLAYVFGMDKVKKLIENGIITLKDLAKAYEENRLSEEYRDAYLIAKKLI